MRRIFGACALMLVLVAACGDHAVTGTSEGEVGTGDGAFPREVLGAIIPSEPSRIVSASATHTEILYALGAGDRVVAVDLYSDYPPEAAAKQQIDSFNLNVEAVAALEPDLVILAYDPGDVAAGLGELGIPTVVFGTAPATLEDAFEEWEAVGAAVGSDTEAAALVAGARSRIEAIVGGIPDTAGAGPTYYHELGEDLYTITSDTFIGSLYSAVGLGNVADAAGPGSGGYVQLSAEYLLAADPDYIFLADSVCCGQSVETLAERPGWGTLRAVESGRVVELDDDMASRWGPRVVDLLETIADAVYGEAG